MQTVSDPRTKKNGPPQFTNHPYQDSQEVSFRIKPKKSMGPVELQALVEQLNLDPDCTAQPNTYDIPFALVTGPIHKIRQHLAARRDVFLNQHGYSQLYSPIPEGVTADQVRKALESDGYVLCYEQWCRPGFEILRTQTNGIKVYFADKKSQERSMKDPITVGEKEKTLTMLPMVPTAQSNPVLQPNQQNLNGCVLLAAGIRMQDPTDGCLLLQLEFSSTAKWCTPHGYFRGEKGDRTIEDTRDRILKDELLGMKVKWGDYQDQEHRNPKQLHRVYYCTPVEDDRNKLVTEFNDRKAALKAERNDECKPPKDDKDGIKKVDWFTPQFLLFCICKRQLSQPTPLAFTNTWLEWTPILIPYLPDLPACSAELKTRWTEFWPKIELSRNHVGLVGPKKAKFTARYLTASRPRPGLDPTIFSDLEDLAQSTLRYLEPTIGYHKRWIPDVLASSTNLNPVCQQLKDYEYTPGSTTAMAALLRAGKQWAKENESGEEGWQKSMDNGKQFIDQRIARKKLPQKLQRDDAIALHFYTREDVGLYKVINSGLREGNLHDEYADLVYWWKSICTDCLEPFSTSVVFRGMGKENSALLLKDSQIYLPSFNSTSYIKSIAEGFADPYLWLIYPRTGVSIECVSKFSTEGEVLLPAGAVLHVKELQLSEGEKKRFGISAGMHVIELLEEPVRSTVTFDK